MILRGIWKCTGTVPSIEESDRPEFQDFRRGFAGMFPLTIIVAVLGMAGHRLPWIGRTDCIEIVLTLPVVLWAAALCRSSTEAQTCGP